MKASVQKCRRVLAIDPSKRGFGFAVLEGPEGLIDWGIKEIRQEKNAKCLRLVSMLIERYCPDVIVIENYQDKDCRRSARIKDLLEDIAVLALSKKVRLRRISRSVLRRTFSQSNAPNKHQIAIEIGKRFPELTVHVPPLRKPWMTQDARMSIFDALAIALTLWRMD